MQDTEVKQFFSSLRRVSLPQEVRVSQRRKLMLLVKQESSLGYLERAGHSFRTTFKSLSLQRTFSGSFSLVAAILLIPGIAFASEQSLPGDVLYPLKTELVEPLRGIFTYGEEASALWHSKLIARRVSEVDTLAQAERLNDTIKERVEAELNEHGGQIQTSIEQFSAQGEIAATKKVEAAFKSALKGGVVVRAVVRDKHIELSNKEKDTKNKKEVESRSKEIKDEVIKKNVLP